MALFRAAISSTTFRDFRRPLIVSSISSTSPRKSLTRKNHLREKLLRTLTLPHPPDPLVSKSPNTKNPIVEIEHSNEGFDSGGRVQLEEESVEFQGTLESIGISDGNAVPEVSVFRVGLWLFGAFVFQTVIAVVWMIVSLDSDEKIGKKDENGGLEIGFRGKDMSKVAEYPSGGVRLQDKIEEIRMMAREVREIEKSEKKTISVVDEDSEGSEDSEDDEEDGFGESGIEKEVRDRLMSLRNRLENGRGKELSIALDDTVKKHGLGMNSLSKGDGLIDRANGRLNLNKRVDNEDVSKDSGSVDDTIHIDDEVDSMNQVQKLDFEGADSINLTLRLEDASMPERAKSSGTKSRKRRGQGTLGKKVGFGKAERKSLKQDMVEGRHENEASKSGDSTTIFGMSTVSNINNALLRYDYFKADQSHLEAKLNKAGNRTGSWWLSLPYVFVIYMRRGGEGLRGLFTLRNGSDAIDTVSYTVAFEGRDDANNFCYILETTFGNLEDYSAEVVPISIKELGGIVESDYSRVIVVKKGQLKLYAGQPLQDVEMALRSLVEQS